MARHSAPEQPAREEDIPTWQIGVGIAFIVFFAALGFVRIVLELVV